MAVEENFQNGGVGELVSLWGAQSREADPKADFWRRHGRSQTHADATVDAVGGEPSLQRAVRVRMSEPLGSSPAPAWLLGGHSLEEYKRAILLFGDGEVEPGFHGRGRCMPTTSSHVP